MRNEGVGVVGRWGGAVPTSGVGKAVGLAGGCGSGGGAVQPQTGGITGNRNGIIRQQGMSELNV